MNNREKYNNAFIESLGVTVEQLENLKYQDVPAWDSVGHMSLISSLENAFDIMFDTMDVIDFSSYEKGKEILSKEEYGIDFNA